MPLDVDPVSNKSILPCDKSFSIVSFICVAPNEDTNISFILSVIIFLFSCCLLLSCCISVASSSMPGKYNSDVSASGYAFSSSVIIL